MSFFPTAAVLRCRTSTRFAWRSRRIWPGTRTPPGSTPSRTCAYLTRCAERELDPLIARRPHIELYVRWMQEVRRCKPSTVSRRMSVVTGFYRTCVIDGVQEHSPAEYVRRPNVPPESPTLGLTHLQLEALLAAARDFRQWE
jgi:integrase/recombinase XerD